jgi:starch synthase
MKILMVSAEYAPLAKTGGLADAVTGLAEALATRGHDVRVLLPRYEHLAPSTDGADQIEGSKFRYVALDARGKTPRVYLLESPELASGGIYTGDEREAGRFLKLCEGAVLLPAELDWQPDVLHCHDWHAALVPALQAARRTDVPVILTLHNIGYQGVFPIAVLAQNGAADLEPLLPTDALAGGLINFLRAGVNAAAALTTVSPTYAKEILTSEFGMGLEDLLSARRADLTGILNGVDYATWSPEHDPLLPYAYDAENLAGKHELKSELCARLGLAPDQSAPLLGVVSRFVPQKGIDLLIAALPTLLAETGARFALLGSGDPAYTESVRAIAAEQPRRVSFTAGYDEPLAHRILAGSDIVLVPSRYEPCGLTQLYALRYGSIPVVRATGGLADTVHHFDRDSGAGTGAVFRDADVGGLLWATREALEWYGAPASWSRLIANAMRADFSWAKQVPAYEAVYRSVL